MSGINLLIRVVVLYGFAYLVAQTARKERLIEELEKLLPICSYCKKIRDEDSVWQPLEAYFDKHEEISFSHGICPDCVRKHFPGVLPE